MFDFVPPDTDITFLDRYETISVPASLFNSEHPLVPSFCPMQTVKIPNGTACTIAFPRFAYEIVPRYDHKYTIGNNNYYSAGYFH